MTPSVLMRPTRSPNSSVNQRFPSGPAAIPLGRLSGVGIGYWVTVPSNAILSMVSPPYSVNHRSPSRPDAIPVGPPGGTEYSVIAPAGVMRPILLLESSVNHRFRSGPTVIASG